MALIRCTECGNSISDKATTCPHCGIPVQTEMVHTDTYLRSRKFKTAANIISMAGLVFMLIGIFAPFATFELFGSSVSKSLFDGDGKIMLILTGVAILCLCVQKKIAFMVFAIANSILAIAEMNHTNKLLEEAEGLGQLWQKGIAFPLLILGSILIVIGIVLHFKAGIRR